MKFQNQLCSFGGEQALIVKRPRKMPFLRNLKKERFLHGCFGLLQKGLDFCSPVSDFCNPVSDFCTWAGTTFAQVFRRRYLSIHRTKMTFQRFIMIKFSAGVNLNQFFLNLVRCK
jgi:hypothetical protein